MQYVHEIGYRMAIMDNMSNGKTYIGTLLGRNRHPVNRGRFSVLANKPLVRFLEMFVANETTICGQGRRMRRPKGYRSIH